MNIISFPTVMSFISLNAIPIILINRNSNFFNKYFIFVGNFFWGGLISIDGGMEVGALYVQVVPTMVCSILFFSPPIFVEKNQKQSTMFSMQLILVTCKLWLVNFIDDNENETLSKLLPSLKPR
jgi:hypothetical protein